jgi:hypothetical protein
MATFIREAPRPGRQPVLLPARKPMRRARRVSLFEREIRVRLSPAAIEVLLDSASILSEGEVESAAYAGSTMITIDLTRASVHLSEACDVATARNVETLLAGDPRVHERARAIAVLEAERLARCALLEMHIDVRVSRSGRHFHLDLCVEAQTGGTP